jgi:hypothetical protein
MRKKLRDRERTRVEEAEQGSVARPYEEQRLEWPPPREQPEREPSHLGARADERDEGWWEKWEEESRGADS